MDTSYFNLDLSMNKDQKQFLEKLLAQRKAYHLEHPFQVAMNQGKLTPDQIRLWTLNRYYYQKCLPLKDAAILSQCPLPAIRKRWVQRILNEDGHGNDPGELEAFIQLGIAIGLDRESITCEKSVLPGVRFAVDSYVHFAKTVPWPEGICSSLTELFAGEAHKRRITAFKEFYPWIKLDGLLYFERRLIRVQQDLEQSLPFVLDYFLSQGKQERALEILQFKMDILWSMLDAISLYSGFPLNEHEFYDDGGKYANN